MAAVRAKIFINYRVQEQPGYACLLYYNLSRQFGEQAVFFASSSIRPGDDYATAIAENLRHCSVLLAIIGSLWLYHDRTDLLRAPGAGFDWVRYEIAEAFSAGLRVIPVLIENAELPTQSALPDGIRALARCQYLRLRHHSIEADLSTLSAELVRTIPELRNDLRRNRRGQRRFRPTTMNSI